MGSATVALHIVLVRNPQAVFRNQKVVSSRKRFALKLPRRAAVSARMCSATEVRPQFLFKSLEQFADYRPHVQAPSGLRAAGLELSATNGLITLLRIDCSLQLLLTCS